MNKIYTLARRQFFGRFVATSYVTLMIAILGLTLSPAVSIAQNGSAAADVHLYFFTNHGCAPCRQVEPGIAALSQEGYPVTTIILNDQPQWGEQFSVNRTPTVIMVADNKIVGRHAGLIDGVTLKQWFAAVGVSSGNRFSDEKVGTKVSLGSSNPTATLGQSVSRAVPSQGLDSAKTFTGSPTLHKGTRQPGNTAEQRALSATVRLKVEDPEGISYATGTIIHCHDGEWLVMTCGHVFRESRGTGQITAEYNFANGAVRSAPGKLISYDSDARDIGLIAVQAGSSVEPVAIADKYDSVDRGQAVFSIGCDQGDNPTIRRSEIKNRAAYDGAIKYDIFGRPVNGRSGGGLFNEQGELIGICNAAAVEVDEGIYTALETVHWQIAKVNLQHLFDSPSTANDNILASHSNSGSGQQSSDSPNRPVAKNGPPLQFASASNGMQPIQTPVAWQNGPPHQLASSGLNSDREVIIIVRSKTDPARAEAITVSHPSNQLLDYLATMQGDATQTRQLDVAQLRK